MQQKIFLEPLELPTVEGFKSTSSDGTIVSGILYRVKMLKEKLCRSLLYIHGGPVARDDYEF